MIRWGVGSEPSGMGTGKESVSVAGARLGVEASGVFEQAMGDASWRCMRPGGWVAFGIYGGPPDQLAQRLADLRTVRSGGHPWTVSQVCDRFGDAGFGDVRKIEREWSAPVRLVVGRRP